MRIAGYIKYILKKKKEEVCKMLNKFVVTADKAFKRFVNGDERTEALIKEYVTLYNEVYLAYMDALDDKPDIFDLKSIRDSINTFNMLLEFLKYDQIEVKSTDTITKCITEINNKMFICFSKLIQQTSSKELYQKFITMVPEKVRNNKSVFLTFWVIPVIENREEEYKQLLQEYTPCKLYLNIIHHNYLKK